MNVDWLNFTPWSSLAGGALIGLAASLFVVGNGRIAGISGLIGSLLQRNREGASEKACSSLACWSRHCCGDCSRRYRRSSSRAAGQG